MWNKNGRKLSIGGWYFFEAPVYEDLCYMNDLLEYSKLPNRKGKVRKEVEGYRGFFPVTVTIEK